MNPFIIAQARMTSTRLPGKVLKSVLNQSLLEFQIERWRQVSKAAGVMVATTDLSSDDPIFDLCQKLDVLCFRGSEEDVLERYFLAAQKVKADPIIRVTSDCPLIDPDVIDQGLAIFLDHPEKYDFVSNTLSRSYPRGLDFEIFPMSCLSKAYQNADKEIQREHVTPYIREHADTERVYELIYKGKDLSTHRWTVDTAEDFELIQKVLEEVYPENRNFRLNDLIKLFDTHPEWSQINAHVQQKHQ